MKEIIKVMDDGTQGRVEHGVVIEIQDDSIGIECLNIMPVDVVRVAIGILKVVHEMGFVDMVDLATMCGALQLLMGLEAVSRGKSLEDVKDNMLDIHLAAMETLTDQVIKERGGECGS